MVRRTQQHRKHAALKLGGVGVLAVVLLGGGLTLASADDGAAPQTANCPTVRDKLSNVPAAAVAGVEQELANLDKQIAEANARLAQQAANPQGGPNFIQNAILGPLASKRTAALDRIGININRVGGQRPDLASLATCGLNAAGVPSAVNGNAGNGNAGNAGNAGNGNAANGNTGNGNAGAGVAQRVSCPTVADRLPSVPAQAAAEVQRELANLESQIADANARLARQAANPQGGPNFVRNAIIGPLEDRRVAAINRIATAIGRVDGNRPADLVNLARPCSAG
ncbi:hypothetical protein [Micromonospora sediminimaris]|uniref:Secreted protein n=1 Tax=Micromonospora sediminimaris TaxID=547162 RepID=A0A9W5UMF9_9ACTN|nr:hypothetical protein [Micromonospora sediminimaris]GIJ31134.1 hypothetical protein Vse01_02820 [Micromonospora sediminimaris]SFC24103.1 hypothetical protein SAMN05216284_103286 [Micromonospora sediminimaris]